MNTLQWYLMGLKIPPINTFIGGVASVIGTKQLLATKLGINVTRISNFSVVGSDIQCGITGSYAIPYGVNLFPSGLTYYDDKNSLVTGTGYIRFYANLHTWSTPKAIPGNYFGRECPLLTVANFPQVLNFLNTDCFYESKCKTYNLNSALTIGTSVGQGNFFYLIPTNSVINVPLALSTVNAGAPDGDIQYAISQRNATVNYI